MKISQTLIIAEAGVNHNGSLSIAKKLIDVSVKAGADAIKFQTFKADLLVSRFAKKSDYQERTTSKLESAYEMLENLELSEEQHVKLIKYANKKGILFLSTPFDEQSVDLLIKYKIPILKISSGDITNLPFLQYLASKNKPIILSTGRSTIKEVKEAVTTILKTGNTKLSLLHCVSNYPASFNSLNLRAIETLKKEFDLPVGFSDHTLGIEASVAAVALGAEIIEKHFTINKNLTGPDHRASLDPSELEKLVESVRNIEQALGDGIKRPAKSERCGTQLIRKGLTAKTDIKKGTILTNEMIVLKRPAKGIEPKCLDKVLGQRVLKNIRQDMPIQWDAIKGKI